MKLLPGIGAELAASVRAVNAAYERIPVEYRPEPAEWEAFSQEVDAACALGNREAALDAIEYWRETYLTKFAGVLLHAPLEEAR